MASKKQPGEHRWLKRILIAVTAAVVTTLFTRRKVLAPSPSFDFHLPPVSDRSTASPAPEPGSPPTHHKEPALDPTSEGFDTSTHEGEEGAVDLTDVALDIDVELELQDEAAPDLTSEGFDTSEPAPAGALASGEGYIRLNNGEHSCPAEFPIKGNANSHIYHLPGQPSYDATIPEFCFSTEEIAQSMGFRPRKH